LLYLHSFPTRRSSDLPSRVMRWCCTIFKAGPINNLLQTMGDQKVLTFYGIRRDESLRRSQYHKLSWNDPDRLGTVVKVDQDHELDRKSTRLNSSHSQI